MVLLVHRWSEQVTQCNREGGVAREEDELVFR